jgi:hypothetical protein
LRLSHEERIVCVVFIHETHFSCVRLQTKDPEKKKAGTFACSLMKQHFYRSLFVHIEARERERALATHQNVEIRDMNISLIG